MVRKIYLALAIFITSMTVSIAHQGATGIVKARMDAMSDMSDRSKQISKMFKGEKDLDRDYIQQSSELFARYAQVLFTQFPDTHQSRMGSKTEALSSIWEDRKSNNIAASDGKYHDDSNGKLHLISINSLAGRSTVFSKTISGVFVLLCLFFSQRLLAQNLGTDDVETQLKADDLAAVARGEEVYSLHCAVCHGAMLEGQPDWRQRDAEGLLPAPPHDETGHTWHHRDDLLFEITKYGASVVIGDESYKTRMPAYNGVISDSDIVAVLSYIKNRWPEEEREYQDSLNGNDPNVFRPVQPKKESPLIKKLFNRD